MPREGSPWTGFSAVYFKELADNLTSTRMRVLEWLVVLTGLAAVYAALQDIRTTTAEDPFVFLALFSHARQPLPSFVSLLGFLVPLMAIGLGFDSVNSEFNRRTMSRILSQPVYRDALLFGKFLAGLTTLAIALLSLWLLVAGLGLLMLGVPPSGEEALRGLSFLISSIAYGGVWLAVAMLFSVIFRSAATSAMCSIGLWLLLTVLWPVLVPFVVQAVAPSDLAIVTGQQTLQQVLLQQGLSRLSPNTLYMESVMAMLVPTTRTLGPIFLSDLLNAVAGAHLAFTQSLILIWPQMTALVSAVIVLFVAAYVTFQRREIRA